MPARKKKIGSKYQPHKLTPERVALLLNALKMGLSYERACQVAGIDVTTLNRWLKNAEDPDKHPDYAAFAEKFHKASAEAELYHATTIHDAAEEDWRASMFYLKARNPQDWGDRQIVEFAWEEHFQEMGMTPDEVMYEFIEFMHQKVAEKQATEAEIDNEDDTEGEA